MVRFLRTGILGVSNVGFLVYRTVGKRYPVQTVVHDRKTECILDDRLL